MPAHPPTEPSSSALANDESHRHHFLSGKRDLEEEVQRLRQIVEETGIPERDELRTELERLRSEVPRLKAEKQALLETVLPLREETSHLRALESQRDALATDVQRLSAQKSFLDQYSESAQKAASEMQRLQSDLAALRAEIVETSDVAILQEVGIYQYRHPLDDSPAYKARLVGVQAQIKDAARAGNAVKGATSWTVNGSKSEGTRMVREFSKLLLRAYNNEADNAVRSMKPYTLESSVARLDKARHTISKLGQTMNIRITDHYHRLRIQELELTADYLAKVAEEKDRDREERARIREEELARREIEREQARLRKEQQHYTNAVEALRSRGDHAAAEQAAAKVAEIEDALDGLTKRAANVRAGHVYVISNIGAFGPDMVKIGMTRRLDPLDRIHELGDASVPFRYDLHALVFSEDAVGLETHLHHEFREKRVNWVNLRREFFRIAPAEVRSAFERLGVPLLEFVEQPEALEWRQTLVAREAGKEAPEPHHRVPHDSPQTTGNPLDGGE